MFARGCARCIEQAWLRNQHERPFGMLSSPHSPLTGRDLFQCAAQVRGSCSRACSGFPGNRSIEGEIDLEYAGAVAIARKLSLVTGGQTIPRYALELARCPISE